MLDTGYWHLAMSIQYPVSSIEGLVMGTSFSVAEGIEHFKFEPGEFIVLEFSGYEGISQLTHFDIRLLSTDQEVDFSTMLNKRASLKIWDWESQDHDQHVYHGIISGFEQLGQQQIGEETYALYRAVMVPLLWRLTLNYQCRIFQEKSVPDIIEEVLKDAGFGGDDYRMALEGTYEPLTKPPQEFCVQYRESDFNFISRLMEDDGIFYFFEYGDSKEVMVIADSSSVHTDTTPMSEIRYEVPSGLQPLEEEYIHPLKLRENVLPNKFMFKDFNYDTPQTNLLASSQINQDASFTVYDYPGRFGFLNQGTTLAGIHNQENEAGRKVLSGGSNCRSLCAGYKYSLSDHPRPDLVGEYVLTRVTHHGIQGGVWAQDARTSYENQFECISADVPYRPPRVTPKARVQGTQTATVVGPSGEKLYMDEKGRAKVQFHWDLEGEKNEKSSCWVRVSHGYAGAKYGIQFHPLVDEEVIVDFLEGDPDRPIIVGRVYNADNMPPLKPEDRIQNIIYTPYQHRLLFDDKKTQIILNTGGKETITMTDAANSSEYGNNINISTADGHFMHLAEGQSAEGITIQTVDQNLIVLDDMNENISIVTKNQHVMQLDDRNKKILVKSTNGHSITIDDQGSNITVIDSTGMHQFKIDISGRKLIISTDTGDIDMKAPLGTINIEGREINIKATMNMKLQAGLNLDSQAGMQHTSKGTMVNSQAAAINSISGGLVKIN